MDKINFRFEQQKRKGVLTIYPRYSTLSISSKNDNAQICCTYFHRYHVYIHMYVLMYYTVVLSLDPSVPQCGGSVFGCGPSPAQQRRPRQSRHLSRCHRRRYLYSGRLCRHRALGDPVPVSVCHPLTLIYAAVGLYDTHILNGFIF